MPHFLRLLCLASCLSPTVVIYAFSASSKPPSGQGGENEQSVKEPEDSAIAKLVKQLGSSDFSERQAASKALGAIGLPALEALRKAAKSDDAEVAQRASRLVTIIENGLDQLLADYRGYGLPLPPKDAKLVRFESMGRYILNFKLMPPTYFLGFLIQQGNKDNPPLLLVGTQEFRLDSHTPFEVIEPKPASLKTLELRWSFGLNAGLVIALQCKARGWNDLAQELWTLCIKQHCGHRFGAFYQPANLPNRTAVAYLAWAHSGNELAKPDSDRTKTAKRMKAVLAAEPRLNNEGNRALLRSLEAALVPSTAKPGTVEKLIDDLIDMCIDMCNVSRRHDEPDPRYLRLGRLGFAAVPALIEHLDDDRLTRSVVQGIHNSPPSNLRIKQVVSDMLQELAGEEDWLRRQRGRVVERADAQAWWDKARKDGEEAYLLGHVLPDDKRAEWPNSLMLDIINEKYPQHLPTLYKTILNERPKVQSWPVAEVVAKSSLSAEKKLELFLQASQHKNLEHRRFGLTHVQKTERLSWQRHREGPPCAYLYSLFH